MSYHRSSDRRQSVNHTPDNHPRDRFSQSTTKFELIPLTGNMQSARSNVLRVVDHHFAGEICPKTYKWVTTRVVHYQSERNTLIIMSDRRSIVNVAYLINVLIKEDKKNE